MAGHRKWGELRDELRARRPDFDERVAKASAALQDEISDYHRALALIREARVLTQTAVRGKLNGSQSDIESGVVEYLSTLARNLELLGIPLDLAVVSDGKLIPLSVGELVGHDEAAP